MRYFEYYLLILSLFGYLCMFVDKQLAIRQKRRISEKFLFTVALIGGAPGILVGMSSFRHKTKHQNFLLFVPLIVFGYIALYIFLNIYFV